MTREYGKIRAVAHGVKKPKSLIAGDIEPFNHIRIKFQFQEGKELGRILETELIDSFLKKNPDLLQIYTYSYFAEIVNEMVQENQPNIPLFRLLLASMKAGAIARIPVSLARYFEIWALRLNGLLPDYTHCVHCGKCVKNAGFWAWIESGEARCEACARSRGVHVGAKSAVMIEKMMKLPPEKFMILPFERESATELEKLTQRLLGFHLEKQLKSFRILREAFRE